ncbi:unnamed protein product [Didymodactylos carnosus]|uniref:Uncharacterized protein n=2 Tax=Didymodactylos carnosus TaxID=1234261 RepID=A0A8S2CXQ2_9BILA|nr:unnamed protein product [Didymodactylos carnosus]CAF3614739.1 unnamed protein product [Didymodactylos carnosus]
MYNNNNILKIHRSNSELDLKTSFSEQTVIADENQTSNKNQSLTYISWSEAQHFCYTNEYNNNTTDKQVIDQYGNEFEHAINDAVEFFEKILSNCSLSETSVISDHEQQSQRANKQSTLANNDLDLTMDNNSDFNRKLEQKKYEYEHLQRTFRKRPLQKLQQQKEVVPDNDEINYARPMRTNTTATRNLAKKRVECRKWCDEQYGSYSESYSTYDTRATENLRHSNTDNIERYDNDYDEGVSDTNRKNRNNRDDGYTFLCRRADIQKPNGTVFICVRKKRSFIFNQK